MSAFSQSPLPQPTLDVARVIADVRQFGYGLLANALTSEQLVTLNTRLDEQAQAELRLGIAHLHGGPKDGADVNQRVFMLVNKGRVFRDLLSAAFVRPIVREFLGEHVLLHSYSANIAKRGGAPADLHTDQWWLPAPVRRGAPGLPAGSMTRGTPEWPSSLAQDSLPPLVLLNFMWMLSDFTDANGATRVVPCSHLSGRHPQPEDNQTANIINAVAPAGTVMVFEGRLWHGVGSNADEQPRSGLLMTFIGPQFRPMENYVVGASPAVLREASPALLELLGFRVWQRYGKLDANAGDDFIRTDTPPLEELQP